MRPTRFTEANDDRIFAAYSGQARARVRTGDAEADDRQIIARPPLHASRGDTCSQKKMSSVNRERATGGARRRLRPMRETGSENYRPCEPGLSASEAVHCRRRSVGRSGSAAMRLQHDTALLRQTCFVGRRHDVLGGKCKRETPSSSLINKIQVKTCGTNSTFLRSLAGGKHANIRVGLHLRTSCRNCCCNGKRFVR